MNTTATCIDFEKILFDDLTAEKPLRQILEHVRLRTGLNVFVLSCDYRPLLYSADQLLTAYFPHLYESGEDVICYMGDEAEQTALREIFHRQTAVVWRPSADDPFFTVFYPTGKEGQPMWLLAIKCSTEAQLALAEQAAPLLASLCASHLADESSGAAALDGGVETTVARELIVFDSPASGSMSLAQFKLQYGALLSGETMSRFCPPFSICAFRSRDPQQAEGDYTQALAEMKEHFPDSFSIVSRGTLYAFFYACDRSCFSELENFSYQFQLRAGLSDRFDTLEERHYFKKQARELLKIGEHTASSKYVFPFFENYTQLLLCNAADRFARRRLCCRTWSVCGNSTRKAGITTCCKRSGNIAGASIRRRRPQRRCMSTVAHCITGSRRFRSSWKRTWTCRPVRRRSRRRSGCVRSIAFPTARISKIKYAARRPHDRSRRRGSCGLPASGAGARVRRSSRGWSWSCSR